MVKDVPSYPALSCPSGAQQTFSLDDTIAIISQAILIEHEAMKRLSNEELHLTIAPNAAPYSLESIQTLGQRLDIAPQYLRQAIEARTTRSKLSEYADKINAQPDLDTIRKLMCQSLHETLENKLMNENQTTVNETLVLKNENYIITETPEPPVTVYTLVERRTLEQKNSYLRALLTRKRSRTVVEERHQKLARVEIFNSFVAAADVCRIYIQDPRFIETCADTIGDICQRYNLKLTTSCTFDPKKVVKY